MKKIGLLLVLLLAVTAIGVFPNQVTQVSAQAEQEVMLNLSHIKCTEDGKLEIHFVLVHADAVDSDGKDIVPGAVTFVDNGTTFSVGPDKHTGDTWHFSYYAANGYHDVTSGSVSYNGQTYDLHAAGTDTGTYNCGSTPTTNTATMSQDSKCSGWSVSVDASEGAEITYDPAQSGDWSSGDSFTVNAHVVWTSGDPLTKDLSVTVTKPDNCGGEITNTAELILDSSCHGWSMEVHASDGASIVYDPAQSGDWSAGSSILIAAHVTWTSGTPLTLDFSKTVTKPDDCSQQPPVVVAPETGGNGPSIWVIIWDWITALFGG